MREKSGLLLQRWLDDSLEGAGGHCGLLREKLCVGFSKERDSGFSMIVLRTDSI